MRLKTIAGITNTPSTGSPLRGYEGRNGLCALRLPAVARGYTQDRASCATAIKTYIGKWSAASAMLCETPGKRIARSPGTKPDLIKRAS